MIQAKLVVKLLSNIIDVHLTIISNNDFLFSDFKKFTPLKHFTLHYILLLTWQPPRHFFYSESLLAGLLVNRVSGG